MSYLKSSPMKQLPEVRTWTSLMREALQYCCLFSGDSSHRMAPMYGRSPPDSSAVLLTWLLANMIMGAKNINTARVFMFRSCRRSDFLKGSL